MSMRVPRKATLALAALVLTLLALPSAASAATCAYSGTGNWQAVGSWNCGHVPTNADDAIIGSGDNVLVDDPTQNAVAGTLAVEGGTLQFANARTLSVSGTTALGSATITGNGELDAGGALTKTTGSQLRIENGATVAVGADSSWSGGDTCVTSGGVLRLEATFTIATGAGGFTCNNTGQIQVVTGGRLLKNSGGTTTVSTLLDNDGTVQAAQGTLSVAAAPTSSADTGTFLADAGAELTLTGARALGATARIGGAGTARVTASITLPAGATLDPATLTLDSGTLSLDGAAPATTLPQVNLSGGTFSGIRNRTITSLTATSGTLAGNHIATVTGAFTKSTGGQMRLEDGVSFRPEGTSTWSGGDFCITTTGVLRLASTFTIATGAGGFVCNNTGQIQVVAGGRLHKTSGGTTTVSTLLDNDGTVQASQGTLSVAAAPAAATDAGTFLADAGGELVLAGARSLGTTGRIGGAGTTRVTSTVTLPNGATLDSGRADAR